jgi:hypothetical protein
LFSNHDVRRSYTIQSSLQSLDRSDTENGLGYTIALQNVVMLKYEALANPGERLRTQNLLQQASTISKCNFLFAEQVGKPNEDNHVPITIQFFVDSETFKALGLTDNKYNIKYLGAPNLPEKLCNDINTCLRARETYLNEKYIPQTGRLATVTLNAYSAVSFAQEKDDILTCLVGDAALGVPYFKALNIGLQCGTRLAQLIYKLSVELVDQAAFINQYNSFMQNMSTKEIIRAHTRGLSVNFLASSLPPTLNSIENSSNSSSLNFRKEKLSLHHAFNDYRLYFPEKELEDYRTLYERENKPGSSCSIS